MFNANLFYELVIQTDVSGTLRDTEIQHNNTNVINPLIIRLYSGQINDVDIHRVRIHHVRGKKATVFYA